jgi:hypothetical protein
MRLESGCVDSETPEEGRPVSRSAHRYQLGECPHVELAQFEKVG